MPGCSPIDSTWTSLPFPKGLTTSDIVDCWWALPAGGWWPWTRTQPCSIIAGNPAVNLPPLPTNPKPPAKPCETKATSLERMFSGDQKGWAEISPRRKPFVRAEWKKGVRFQKRMRWCWVWKSQFIGSRLDWEPSTPTLVMWSPLSSKMPAWSHPPTKP